MADDNTAPAAPPLDPALEQLRREADYYKRQVDELAGENLRLDYSISGLRHELNQKRQGFALLSGLQLSISAEKHVSAIFEKSAAAINSTLGMDRTVILTATNVENHFRPTHLQGFVEEEAERLRQVTLPFEPEFTRGGGFFIVAKATPKTPEIERMRAALEIPFFICLPVMGEGTLLGILVCGRKREAKPLYPPIDQGDADTLLAISGLIASVVKNMKVAVLEEMDRVKTEFFSNISHEFRTPITLTLGPIDALLGGRYGEVPVPVREQLGLMQRNQQRLLGLINQILDLAKLEAGRMKLQAAPISDMNRFVEERVALFRTMAERRGIELRTAFDPAVDGAELFIDREGFDKLLFNLLSNAHKFTKKGFIEVSTAIADGQLRVTVSDTGIGIREDQLPYMFERFRQADGSASREFAGTGLGLAMVKEVAKLHGGDVSVQSEYGKGTTFKVVVPLGKAHLDPSSIVERPELETHASAPLMIAEGAEADSEQGGRGDAEQLNKQSEASLDLKRPTVLYTDDNADLRAFVRDVLAPHYNVFLAVDGGDGVKKALKYRPDLILSDLMMPHVTGTQFCQQVRGHPDLKMIPFVLLTAKSALDSKIEGLEEGADDYLSKPFAEPELLARIKNLVRLRENQLRLKRELDSARKIQLAMLPPRLQRFGALELEALYRPSTELSGDFFDTIELGEWLYFYLADVTSHGTAAAQVTYAVKGLFRQALAAGGALPLDTLLATVSQEYRAFGLDFDVSLQAARAHSPTGRLEYSYGSAPFAMLVRGEESSLLEGTQGPHLSQSAARGGYSVHTFNLAAGDFLYFITDGCYEFKAGSREFGRRRLLRLLASQKRAGWTDTVFGALSEANGSPFFEDDLTMLRLSVVSSGT